MECNIDTKLAAGERGCDPRGARPRICTDSHHRRLAPLPDFPLHSVTLPGSASAKSPNPATCDATSGKGAPAARSGAWVCNSEFTCTCRLARMGTRRDVASIVVTAALSRKECEGLTDVH